MLTKTLKFKVPGGDSWFQVYLANIGASVLDSTKEVDNPIKTISDWLWKTFSETIQVLFEIHKIEKSQLRVLDHQSETVSDGLFPFPIILQQRNWESPLVQAELKLESMVNGHMGYNEDDFSASFVYGDKKIILRCYIFVSDMLTVELTGIDEDVEEKICQFLSGHFTRSAE